MRIVIADDLTGAAEIAGIAHRLGWRTALHTTLDALADVDVLVLDADSRELPAAAADQRWRTWTARLREANPADSFFKKCDSALRGHVVRETLAMTETLPAPRALLLPANPSRGRVIRDGSYLIDGVPLHQTPFGRDPHHPASSSRVRDLLGDPGNLVELPDVTTAADLVAVLRAASADTLIVGGADAFTAWCPPAESAPPSPPAQGAATRLLIINGSTAPFDATGLAALGMRYFAAGTPLDTIRTALAGRGRVHAAVGPHDLAELQALARLALEQDGVHLALTGGATARAACETLNLHRFTVGTEWAPGVVSLMPATATRLAGLSLKPGSYAWPEQFFTQIGRP